MTVLKFPDTHIFLICRHCDEGSWFLMWPQDNPEEWYVECTGCGQQYYKGIMTGEETPKKLKK